MSKSTQFKTGDIVVLKSGGPTMTIKSEKKVGIPERHIGYYCQWFAGKKLVQGDFPTDSLKLAPNDAKP